MTCWRASSLVESGSVLKSRMRGASVKRAAGLPARGANSAQLKFAKDCTVV